MIIEEKISIVQNKSGRFKCYWIGVSQNHTDSWRGEGMRCVTIPIQPLRGYKTLEEAREFLKREKVFIVNRGVMTSDTDNYFDTGTDRRKAIRYEAEEYKLDLSDL